MCIYIYIYIYTHIPSTYSTDLSVPPLQTRALPEPSPLRIATKQTCVRLMFLVSYVKYIYRYICIYVYLSISLSLYIYIYIHIYTYTHAHKKQDI